MFSCFRLHFFAYFFHFRRTAYKKMRLKAFVLFVYRAMDCNCFSGRGVPCRGNCRYCNVGEKVTCEAD